MQLLGVQPGASSSTIASAASFKLQSPPSHGFSPLALAVREEVVRAARATLGNADTRAKYDAELASARFISRVTGLSAGQAEIGAVGGGRGTVAAAAAAAATVAWEGEAEGERGSGGVMGDDGQRREGRGQQITMGGSAGATSEDGIMIDVPVYRVSQWESTSGSVMPGDRWQERREWGDEEQ